MAVSRRSRSTRGLVILLVTASLVTITLDYREGTTGPLAAAGDAALSVIAPLQRAVNNVTRPVGEFLGALVHLPSLKDQVNSLQNENHQLKTTVLEDQSLRLQLRELQKLFAVEQTLDFKTTGARVIASSVSNFEWSVVIDKGSGDGMKVGMPVMNSQGLVGSVTRVGRLGSKVTLLIDPDSDVAARLLTSQETGLVTGQGNKDMEMRFVSGSVDVRVGDAVQTAGYAVNGLPGRYPSNIPIGSVSGVSVDPSTGDKLVSVRPYVDFSSLDYVLVVLSPSNQ